MTRRARDHDRRLLCRRRDQGADRAAPLNHHLVRKYLSGDVAQRLGQLILSFFKARTPLRRHDFLGRHEAWLHVGTGTQQRNRDAAIDRLQLGRSTQHGSRRLGPI